MSGHFKNPFQNLSAVIRCGFLVWLLVICTTGCVIPLPSKTISQHRYTHEEIAFLDLPRTTRAEVVSSLGLPSAEVRGPSALLYTWETEGRFYYIPPPAPAALDSHSSVEGAKEHNWGLFIAFDQNGCVSAHEVRKLGNQDPQRACEKWALGKIR
jgi:hypothetical protein